MTPQQCALYVKIDPDKAIEGECPYWAMLGFCKHKDKPDHAKKFKHTPDKKGFKKVNSKKGLAKIAKANAAAIKPEGGKQNSELSMNCKAVLAKMKANKAWGRQLLQNQYQQLRSIPEYEDVFGPEKKNGDDE